MALDLSGIAQVIMAVGVAVPSIVGAVVSVIVLKRGNARDVKLDTIQEHVNGMNKMIAAGAHAEGVLAGVAAEQAHPTEPRDT